MCTYLLTGRIRRSRSHYQGGKLRMACLRRSPGLPSPFNSRREYICQLDQCHIPYLIIHTLFSQQQRWIGVNHRRLRLQIHDGSVHDRKASYLCLTNCSEHIMVSSLTESNTCEWFQVLVCRPLCRCNVGRHREPRRQRELHEHHDTFQLLEAVSDSL